MDCVGINECVKGDFNNLYQHALKKLWLKLCHLSTALKFYNLLTIRSCDRQWGLNAPVVDKNVSVEATLFLNLLKKTSRFYDLYDIRIQNFNLSSKIESHNSTFYILTRSVFFAFPNSEVIRSKI